MAAWTKFVEDMTAAIATRRHGAERFASSWAFNGHGLPCMSVPCGFDPNRPPIGSQIGGRPFAEGAMQKAAESYQQHFDRHMRRLAIVSA